ncbi:MAG: hypothetical protein ACFFDK_10545 [Promethearchaeota archaeon]
MLSDQFLEIIESLISGESFKISDFFTHIINENPNLQSSSLRYEKFKEDLEKNYYNALSKFLASRKFDKFRRLFEISDKLEIFINVKKIPRRFEIISDLHLSGIQSGQIGNIIEIIRFFNEYNLFERTFTKHELEIIDSIKRKDKALIANLNDLFGKVSNSLIWYSCKIMPYDLYLIYLNNTSTFPDDEYFFRTEYNLSFLKIFFDRYSIYGLSVQKLGDIRNFINRFEKHYLPIKNNSSNNELQLLKFRFGRKTHLVSINNILKNYEKILDFKNLYKFFSLSMVLLGGLGPQGHGFTYSTPRGEIVEICSDRRENRAIIIKYKEFLKKQFLAKLEKVMVKKNIDSNIIKNTIEYLSEALNPEEIVNYYKMALILKQVNEFFIQNQETHFKNELDFKYIIDKVSNAIKIILRPIQMVDQFKCRMDLVNEDKIQSEDIAKLTSLKGKSHYDVLRERFFFQNEIKWFFKDYAEELSKSERPF